MSEEVWAEEVWSEAEWSAFYQMADTFVAKANVLVGTELTDDIAAAMLYACARFNTFAMQSELDRPDALGDEAVDYLAEEFESHLRDHMEEQICPNPGSRDNPVGGPERAVALLRALDGRREEEVSDFLTLADQFLGIANGLVGRARTGRISAAFMHGATRFNVYAMQCLGHPPNQIDEALVADFREIYTDLVYYHSGEPLIAPRG